MNNIPNKFLVTTPGISATRWLCFALKTRKNIFVSHGKHPLDSIEHGDFVREKNMDDIESCTLGNKTADFYAKSSLSEIFEAYYKIKPDAVAYGNIHAFTIESLMQKADTQEELDGIRIINVLRHPINYIASHFSLVKSSVKHPDLFHHYEKVMMPQAIQQFPELALFDHVPYLEFMAFAVSCLSVCNLAYDFAYPQFLHVQMEELTTESIMLKDFCEYLTGQEYSLDELNKLIQLGAINQHEKNPTSKDPKEIYESWETWKQDLFHMMIPVSVLSKLQRYGYTIFQ